MEYKIKKDLKEVFSAQKVSDDKKNIHQYDFEKKVNGWHIVYWKYNVDSPFPERKDMYLPLEVVEQILLVESTKNNLSE